MGVVILQLFVESTTAGTMLNGEQSDLKNGFSVFVPTADYYTSDGQRIEQNGVQPNIVLGEDEDALHYTIDQLIK